MVGADTFYINIYYTITSKIPKIRKKNSKLFWSSKKAQAVMLVSYRRTLYNFKTIEWKL